MNESNCAINTDIELWREIEGDYYAPSIHRTHDRGIGINVGGHVFVKPLREWHKLAVEEDKKKGLTMNKLNRLNRLKGLSGYLSGPIDFEDDQGHGWRDAMTPFLEEKNVRVFNPLKHSFYGTNSIDTIKRPLMDKLLEAGKFHELREEVREISHWDLRSLDLSSFVIVNYNHDVRMCGTMDEIFTANKQTKPVLLMVGNKLKKLSKWMYGRFPPEHMFTSWDALRTYLDNVDHGPEAFMSEADLKRWLFFDGPHARE